jgi:hypothetical protein
LSRKIAANGLTADALPNKNSDKASHLFAVHRKLIAEPLDTAGIPFCGVLAAVV